MPRVRSGSLSAAFYFAARGIIYVFRTQRNMRIHVCAAAGVLVLAGILGVSRVEVAVLLLCILAVLTLEMLNTVVEAVVDLATEQYHPLAKIAKDMAAGAVLVMAIGAAAIGLLILGPPLVQAIGW
ncbi:MAG TPA: diacylglycerol kinase family protein [Chloroflexota bacterium]|nr:diacylglycerol kinase family protein [Chloroflexota bacterium]